MEFVLLVIGIILLSGIIFVEDIMFNTFFKILSGITCFMCIYFATYLISSDTAYKEALKGNNIYKMEIRYYMKDSAYVPSDTVFVLIKK